MFHWFVRPKKSLWILRSWSLGISFKFLQFFFFFMTSTGLEHQPPVSKHPLPTRVTTTKARPCCYYSQSCYILTVQHFPLSPLSPLLTIYLLIATQLTTHKYYCSHEVEVLLFTSLVTPSAWLLFILNTHTLTSFSFPLPLPLPHLQQSTMGARMACGKEESILKHENLFFFFYSNQMFTYWWRTQSKWLYKGKQCQFNHFLCIDGSKSVLSLRWYGDANWFKVSCWVGVHPFCPLPLSSLSSFICYRPILFRKSNLVVSPEGTLCVIRVASFCCWRFTLVSCFYLHDCMHVKGGIVL